MNAIADRILFVLATAAAIALLALAIRVENSGGMTASETRLHP